MEIKQLYPVGTLLYVRIKSDIKKKGWWYRHFKGFTIPIEILPLNNVTAEEYHSGYKIVCRLFFKKFDLSLQEQWNEIVVKHTELDPTKNAGRYYIDPDDISVIFDITLDYPFTLEECIDNLKTNL